MLLAHSYRTAVAFCAADFLHPGWLAAALAQQVKDAEEDFADTVTELKRKAQENLDHLKALHSAL